MPLPPDLTEFVAAEVAKGCYRTQDDLLSDAVRLLRERKLHVLRREIQRGLDSAARGELIEINSDEELAAFFDEILEDVRNEIAAGEHREE